jgi:hypothetical protein
MKEGLDTIIKYRALGPLARMVIQGMDTQLQLVNQNLFLVSHDCGGEMKCYLIRVSCLN